MQMRPGGSAGASRGAEPGARVDLLADLDVDAGEMGVAGLETVSVIDFHHLSVAAIAAALVTTPDPDDSTGWP